MKNLIVIILIIFFGATVDIDTAQTEMGLDTFTTITTDHNWRATLSERIYVTDEVNYDACSISFIKTAMDDGGFFIDTYAITWGWTYGDTTRTYILTIDVLSPILPVTSEGRDI